MRAIWSGAIGFGLVNIPVKMYSAIQESSLDLDMLDKHDNANIRYARINEKTGEEVAWGDIVKGYKLNNKYVVLQEEDFKKASPKKSQVIEIEEFAEQTDIGIMYYEAPYYLAPGDNGDRSYVLLREALAETGKVAIGTYVMRGKEHLCILSPLDDAIVLYRLRFAEEIRDTSGLDLPARSTVKPGEMKMAKALIAQLTASKPSLKKYKDTYHSALMKLIRLRSKGKAAPETKFKLVHSKTKDLMAQLKASLEEKKTKRKAG